jgi:micrococcal nuclease
MVLYTAIGLLGLSVVSCRLTESSKAAGDWSAYDQKSYIVRHIIDGDTVEIESPDMPTVRTKVRLIGVDAPEANSYWADAATRYVDARADEKSVTIRLEPTRTRDRYGRLLAYVYLSDRESLNLALVRDGQAYADRRFRHTMASQFEQAENAARKKGTGLWKDVREQQMPEWRQRWLTERAAGEHPQ